PPCSPNCTGRCDPAAGWSWPSAAASIRSQAGSTGRLPRAHHIRSGRLATSYRVHRRPRAIASNLANRHLARCHQTRTGALTGWRAAYGDSARAEIHVPRERRLCSRHVGGQSATSKPVRRNPCTQAAISTSPLTIPTRYDPDGAETVEDEPDPDDSQFGVPTPPGTESFNQPGDRPGGT